MRDILRIFQLFRVRLINNSIANTEIMLMFLWTNLFYLSAPLESGNYVLMMEYLIAILSA